MAAKKSTFAFLPIPEFKAEFKHKTDAKFFEHGYNMRAAQVNEVAYRDVSWEWKVTKETNKPDQLRVTFFSTFDKSSIASKKKVEQFIEFYPAFDRSQNPKREVVGCEFDDDAGTFAAFNSKGVTTEFKAANIGTISGYKGTLDGWAVDATVSAKKLGELVGDDQVTVNCTITKDFPKLSRDYAMFMDYKGKSGVRAFSAGGAAEDFGVDDTEFHFDEPQYDFGEVEDSDYIMQTMDSQVKQMYANDLDSTQEEGFGEMRMETDFMLTPYYYADDKLRASFELDLPDHFMKDGAYVFQYVQLTPDSNPGSVYTTIACETQIGVANSQVVSEFAGTSRMDKTSTAVAGKKVHEQNKSEKSTDSTWKANKDTSLYAKRTSEIAGNTIQGCIGEYPINKKQGDTSIYTTWRG
jgi:hypothetical protein